MNIFIDEEHKNHSCRLVADLEAKIKLYAPVSHYVLITGERGTGKTTIARRLHEESSRNKKEFINLNCASLSEGLLEAELFGYERGAFTGAAAAKAGLFEIAHGGTLFLDEIGEISLSLQAKLLKAVEEKRIRRVGSNAERPVDVRIISATSQNLKEMVEKGNFRADLYDRLNILNLETVPLRHQKEKIKELVLSQFKAESIANDGRRSPQISPEALELLEKYDWHGNFREILNFTTRLTVEYPGEVMISADAVRKILGDKINGGTLNKTDYLPHHNFRVSNKELVTVTFDPETETLDSIYLKAAGSVIEHILAENGGSLRGAARVLEVNHMTISRILAKFNADYEVAYFPLPLNKDSKFRLAA